LLEKINIARKASRVPVMSFIEFIMAGPREAVRAEIFGIFPLTTRRDKSPGEPYRL
jgi:hypothetical protein